MTDTGYAEDPTGLVNNMRRCVFSTCPQSITMPGEAASKGTGLPANLPSVSRADRLMPVQELQGEAR